MDPVVARALADQKKRLPKLDFGPLTGTFVSKHSGGRPVQVTKVTGFYGFAALIFKTPLNEDLDGAPNSYAPPISVTNLAPQGGLVMIETSIKNATNETGTVFHADPKLNTFQWTGVKSAAAGDRLDQRDFLKDSLGRFPMFRPAGDAYAAYYAPQTAMNGADGQAVNPIEVPYAALSNSLKRHGRVELGDVGLAIRVSTGASTGFIYADAGGGASTSVGECSRKMIRNLFGGPATTEDICYVVFPYTSAGAVARPELIPALLRGKLKDLELFGNADEFVDRCANPQFGEPLDVGRRFIPPAGFRMTLQQRINDQDQLARVNVEAALRRWGAP
ncbi:MAG TPA: hypothetical protein VGQ90_10800 [Stellaceae bacterium]|nr:hypothetical protein [Stellaceae bacterium]